MVGVMNYIKDIPISNGKDLFNCVVEISCGDNTDYQIDDGGEYLVFKRALNSIFVCPFNIGFIPQTRNTKGTLTRAVIISRYPIARLSVVQIRPIGTITVSDKISGEEIIIAVPACSSVKKVSVSKIASFFKNAYYSDIEDISVGNYIQDSDFASKVILGDHQDYMDSQVTGTPIPTESKLLEIEADQNCSAVPMEEEKPEAVLVKALPDVAQEEPKEVIYCDPVQQVEDTAKQEAVEPTELPEIPKPEVAPSTNSVEEATQAVKETTGIDQVLMDGDWLI